MRSRFFARLRDRRRNKNQIQLRSETITRTSSSILRAAAEYLQTLNQLALSALRFSGRFRVMRAIPSAHS